MPSLTGLGILSFPFPGTAVPGYRLFRPYGTEPARLDIVSFDRRLSPIQTVCPRQSGERGEGWAAGSPNFANVARQSGESMHHLTHYARLMIYRAVTWSIIEWLTLEFLTSKTQSSAVGLSGITH
jgi:hypothetical protein